MYRHLALLLVLLTSSAQAADPPRSVLKSDFYRLHHAPGHEADGKRVQQLLDASIAALTTEFDGLPVADLLRVDCAIYLHPKGSGKASEYQVSITTRQDGDKYSAVIDLLMPSAYSASYRSNVGEPAGDDYFAKLIMHEYSTILLERITRTKKGGWGFYSAPGWFTDGYEEYLGLMLTTPRNRKEVLAKYLATYKAGPGRVTFEFGVSVADPYIDGALLLLFMHEEFGKKRVQAILTSREPRFGKAVTAELGVGLDEFQKRWGEWVKKKRD
jgi:hypothetical protein